MMNHFLKKAACAALLIIPLQPELRAVAFDPVGLLLTFVDNPATSMVIDWHTEPEEADRSILYWRKADEPEWFVSNASQRPFPFSTRTINRAALRGLESNAEYVFHFGEGSRQFRFRTLPDSFARPLRLIIGGDTRHSQSMMEATNRQALKQDPDLIIWGGDLAYADGRADRVDRWYEWFDAIRNTLIHEDGRVIPILAGVGNHEVRGGYWHRHVEAYATAGDLNAHREQLAPYFLNLLAFPGQPGFGVIDIGDMVSLVMLDTDHLNPIAGAQTYWLRNVLANRSEVPWILPVYHVPAWPSVRNFNGRSSVAVREHWLPLFERSQVRLAFEHHDHAYKRTLPIRAGQVTDIAKGIVYFGDGAWGVHTREVHSVDETWYLAHAESVHHLILMTIHDEQHADVTVIDPDGRIVDKWRFD